MTIKNDLIKGLEENLKAQKLNKAAAEKRKQDTIQKIAGEHYEPLLLDASYIPMTSEQIDILKEKKKATEHEDITDQAHPESVFVADAPHEGGMVENANEQHEKMIEKALKPPTGVHIMGLASEVREELVKIAGELSNKGADEEAEEILSLVNDFFLKREAVNSKYFNVPKPGRTSPPPLPGSTKTHSDTPMPTGFSQSTTPAIPPSSNQPVMTPAPTTSPILPTGAGAAAAAAAGAAGVAGAGAASAASSAAMSKAKGLWNAIKGLGTKLPAIGAAGAALMGNPAISIPVGIAITAPLIYKYFTGAIEENLRVDLVDLLEELDDLSDDSDISPRGKASIQTMIKEARELQRLEALISPNANPKEMIKAIARMRALVADIVSRAQIIKSTESSGFFGATLGFDFQGLMNHVEDIDNGFRKFDSGMASVVQAMAAEVNALEMNQPQEYQHNHISQMHRPNQQNMPVFDKPSGVTVITPKNVRDSQKLLNKFLGLSIPITGDVDEQTELALEKFVDRMHTLGPMNLTVDRILENGLKPSIIRKLIRMEKELPREIEKWRQEQYGP